ncbi:MAG: hypothetical protein CMJ36_03150 [Phycisphaerae bacterium]|nr:hypothetical protein [Phycisphaerae bacterium]
MSLFSSGFNMLLIILGFGLLIFVHELGHFLAAKWAGIRTLGFSIGFGPPICSWRKGIGFRAGSTYEAVRERTGKHPGELTDEELAGYGLGETEYSLRWLPLGGFVKMLGQDDVDPSASSAHPRSFNMQSIGARMVVISAGGVMNLLLAAVLFVVAFSAGVRFEAPIIGIVAPGTPAATTVPLEADSRGIEAIGLQPGDRILSIDGEPTNTFGDVLIATAMGRPDIDLRIVVEREGVDAPINFEMAPVKSEVSGLLGIGVMPASSTRLIDDPEAIEFITAELDRLGLSRQGVKPGMTLASVDGRPLSNWESFETISRNSDGRTLETSWVMEPATGTDARVSAELEPLPEWEQLRYVGASPSMSVGYEQGLLGLVPLVQIGALTEGSPNEGILEPGDVVLRIGRHQAPRMRTFRDAIPAHGAGLLDMSVLREGKRVDVQVRIMESGILDPRPVVGVNPVYAWDVPRIARPMVAIETTDPKTQEAGETPTPLAGRDVMGGSILLAVDGHSIEEWTDLWEGLHAAAVAGRDSISIELKAPTPGGEVQVVELPLDAGSRSRLLELGWSPPIPLYYFEPLYVVRSAGGNPLNAISMGLQETTKLVVLTYLTIDRLFRGTVGVEQLHGPLGIVHLGTKVADRGFTYLLFFLGLISVNLAVINFLPLPIVDGGLFLYLVYEKIKGRPPSVGFQNGAAIAGLLLIATAFVVTFYNDIARIIG